MAVAKNNIEIINLLLSNPDIDVNKKAVFFFILKILYNFRISIFLEFYFLCIFKSALHLAVSDNKIEIVKLLLSHPKIDINLKSILPFFHDILI